MFLPNRGVKLIRQIRFIMDFFLYLENKDVQVQGTGIFILPSWKL